MRAVDENARHTIRRHAARQEVDHEDPRGDELHAAGVVDELAVLGEDLRGEHFWWAVRIEGLELLEEVLLVLGRGVQHEDREAAVRVEVEVVQEEPLHAETSEIWRGPEGPYNER